MDLLTRYIETLVMTCHKTHIFLVINTVDIVGLGIPNGVVEAIGLAVDLLLAVTLLGAFLPWLTELVHKHTQLCET